MRHQRDREAGWTLVELIVVLGIVVMLFSLSLPSLLGIRRNAYDMQVKMELTTAAKAAASIEVELDRYPDDPSWFSAVMPELDFSGLKARSVHIVVGDVGADPGAQVLLYARSVTDDWFGLRLVRSGPEAGRHTCSGEIDIMTLDACTGVDW